MKFSIIFISAILTIQSSFAGPYLYVQNLPDEGKLYRYSSVMRGYGSINDTKCMSKRNEEELGKFLSDFTTSHSYFLLPVFKQSLRRDIQLYLKDHESITISEAESMLSHKLYAYPIGAGKLILCAGIVVAWNYAFYLYEDFFPQFIKPSVIPVSVIGSIAFTSPFFEPVAKFASQTIYGKSPEFSKKRELLVFASEQINRGLTEIITDYPALPSDMRQALLSGLALEMIQFKRNFSDISPLHEDIGEKVKSRLFRYDFIDSEFTEELINDIKNTDPDYDETYYEKLIRNWLPKHYEEI